MQTFLPEGSDFQLGAAVLDGKRLLKQALESYQILEILAGKESRWANHPAVKMWRGCEGVLYAYTSAVIDEIEARGYKNTTRAKIDDFVNDNFAFWTLDSAPGWLYDDRIRITHQGRLWEKSPEHYKMYEDSGRQFRKMLCHAECNYFWPTHIVDYSLYTTPGGIIRI